MLSLEDGQLKEVKPEMTVKQIREMKKPELNADLVNKYLTEFWNHWMDRGVQKQATENPGQIADILKKRYGTRYSGGGFEDFDYQSDRKGILFRGKGSVDLTWAKAAKFLRELIDSGVIWYTEPEKKEEPVATSHRSEKCIHRPEPQPEPVSALGFAKTVRPEGSLIDIAGCGDGKYDCFSCHRDCGLRQQECYCVHAQMGNPYPCTIVRGGLEQLRTVPEGCQFLNLDIAYHRAGDGEPVPCCEKCDYRESCDSACDRVKIALATSHKDAAEVQHEEPECCDDAAEVYTPRYFLEEQKARLDEILALGEDDVKSLPRKMVERQKTIVAALAAMVCDLEEPEKPEQPELPVFKNNDQRKEWLRNYRDWGLWYADSNIGARYYRYEFENGAVLIAEEYENSYKYTRHYVTSYLHLVGGPEPTKGTNGIGKWQRNEKYNRYQNNETELVEFLKEVQKK